MPSEISVRRILKMTLWKLWEEEDQTWAYWQLILPSNTDCEVNDESRWPQLGKLSCKNRNDLYETDSDLARLFYGWEQIKRVPSWRNFIADLFYGWGRIKMYNSRQIFYGGRQIKMRSQIYKQAKRRKEWGRSWGIFSHRWSAEIF